MYSFETILDGKQWPARPPQVGLFAPPEEISAAVMLETLYYYALAHQNDFDGACICIFFAHVLVGCVLPIVG
jgi:hypothetical protein